MASSAGLGLPGLLGGSPLAGGAEGPVGAAGVSFFGVLIGAGALLCMFTMWMAKSATVLLQMEHFST